MGRSGVRQAFQPAIPDGQAGKPAPRGEADTSVSVGEYLEKRRVPHTSTFARLRRTSQCAIRGSQTRGTRLSPGSAYLSPRVSGADVVRDARDK